MWILLAKVWRALDTSKKQLGFLKTAKLDLLYGTKDWNELKRFESSKLLLKPTHSVMNFFHRILASFRHSFAHFIRRFDGHSHFNYFFATFDVCQKFNFYVLPFLKNRIKINRKYKILFLNLKALSMFGKKTLMVRDFLQ